MAKNDAQTTTDAPAQTPEATATTTTTPARSFTAPPVPEGQHYFWAIGRRKKAIARVRIRPGSGKVVINNKDLETYFKLGKDRSAVVAPLEQTNMRTSWDVWANASGGGPTGQADAIQLGLARAIVGAVPETHGLLKDHALLTRDSRMKERKKPGLRGARKSPQWTKR